MRVKKTAKIIGLFLIPIITISYGIGDLCGWWNKITHRDQLINGYNRLISGEGYPKSWIFKGEKEFPYLYSFILKNTINDKIKEIKKEGYDPILITIDGGGTLSWPIPDDWATSTVTFKESQIIFGYPLDPKIFEVKKATWAGSLADLERWIEREKNNERFYVTTLLITLLGILFGLIDIKKTKK